MASRQARCSQALCHASRQLRRSRTAARLKACPTISRARARALPCRCHAVIIRVSMCACLRLHTAATASLRDAAACFCSRQLCTTRLSKPWVYSAAHIASSLRPITQDRVALAHSCSAARWSLASHTRRILCIFPRATSASWVMPAQPSKAMASRRASRLRLTDCARQRSTAAWRVWAAHTAMAAAMRTAEVRITMAATVARVVCA
mmetsp:Transcript_25909/g.70241  ORF Transcript_25909/g.70241 Transcript_25909/m.70241 type:complete len:206 (-) Transcript_25909:677-1294(-)